MVVCPVVQAHESLTQLSIEGRGPDAEYWRALERRLSEACDELLVLCLPGWAESRGVANEIRLFESLGKPITFTDDVDRLVATSHERERLTDGSTS